MTKIIIDSNIVFSAILNINSRIGQILINGQKYYDFFSPEYTKTEILRHKNKIKEIANLTDNEFLEVYELILRNITFLNHNIVPLEFYKKANAICESFDIDDSVFVAFSEYFRRKLWAGDKKLIKGLIETGIDRFITTGDLYKDFLKRAKNK